MTNVKFMVCYRHGGTMACSWHLVSERCSADAAKKTVRELETMGYRAIVHPVEQYRDSGLPVGWEANSVDWERDQIEVLRFSDGMQHTTKWRSHKLDSAA